MTAEELRAHRREQDAAKKEAEARAADRAAWALEHGEAFQEVDRHQARGNVTADVFRRQQIRLACALRLTGATLNEIAIECNVSRETVRRWLTEAQAMTVQATLQLFETQALPLALDNMIDGLRNGHEKYTLEALKGGGILKQRGDGASAPPPLAMQIVFATPDNLPMRPVGGFGAPRTIDQGGEDVEEKDSGR